MNEDRENTRLRACLREIYRTFQYGPGASSSQAPFIMRMIADALGWETATKDGGAGPAEVVLAPARVQAPQASPHTAGFGGAGGSGGIGYVGRGAISVTVGTGGGGGAHAGGFSVVTINDRPLAEAKRTGRPVSMGGYGGAGKSFQIWIFPDGHTETLTVGEAPIWPKDAPQNVG